MGLPATVYSRLRHCPKSARSHVWRIWGFHIDYTLRNDSPAHTGKFRYALLNRRLWPHSRLGRAKRLNRPPGFILELLRRRAVFSSPPKGRATLLILIRSRSNLLQLFLHGVEFCRLNDEPVFVRQEHDLRV